jgi:hypothetical protein
VTDFGAVYKEAGIEPPTHGYGLDKTGEMLDNKRLATLSREVRATAVLTALEAAGVAMEDVIRDAVRRDKALDAFEAAKRQELGELKQQSAARIQAIQDEIERLLKEKNAEIEALKGATEAAEQAFAQLELRKRREEERLHAVVSHFVTPTENPITTGGAPAAPAPDARTNP